MIYRFCSADVSVAVYGNNTTGEFSRDSNSRRGLNCMLSTIKLAKLDEILGLREEREQEKMYIAQTHNSLEQNRRLMASFVLSLRQLTQASQLERCELVSCCSLTTRPSLRDLGRDKFTFANRYRI